MLDLLLALNRTKATWPVKPAIVLLPVYTLKMTLHRNQLERNEVEFQLGSRHDWTSYTHIHS